MKEKKILALSIKRKFFDEILEGTKKVETRELRPNSKIRYIEYVNPETGKTYNDDIEAEMAGENLEKLEVRPVRYDALKLLTGAYNVKPRPYIIVAIKKAEIVVLTDEYDEPFEYEYKGNKYVAAVIDYHLGEIIEDESAKKKD